MSSISKTSSFHNPKYADCIEACNHCANSCEYCGTLCLREASKTLLECVELCFYCADLCRFASKHMSCDSNRVKEFCDYCARARQTVPPTTKIAIPEPTSFKNFLRFIFIHISWLIAVN